MFEEDYNDNEQRLARELRRLRNSRRSRRLFVFAAITGLILFGLGAARGMPFLPFPFFIAFGIPALLKNTRIRQIELQLAEMRQRTLSARLSETGDSISAEAATFRSAKSRDGILTPVLLTMDSGMSLETAEKTLDSLAKRGYAEVEFNEEGKLFFVFPEFRNNTGIQKL